MVGRLGLAGVLCVCLWAVCSGEFYALAGDGRLVGLNEQPLWHGHAAAGFASWQERYQRFDGVPCSEGVAREPFLEGLLNAVPPERTLLAVPTRVIAAAGAALCASLGRHLSPVSDQTRPSSGGKVSRRALTPALSRWERGNSGE